MLWQLNFISCQTQRWHSTWSRFSSNVTFNFACVLKYKESRSIVACMKVHPQAQSPSISVWLQTFGILWVNSLPYEVCSIRCASWLLKFARGRALPLASQRFVLPMKIINQYSNVYISLLFILQKVQWRCKPYTFHHIEI